MRSSARTVLAGILVGVLGAGVIGTGSAAEDQQGRAQPGSTDQPRLVKVGSYEQPVFVTAKPGDSSRLFVVEKGGRILVVRKGRTLRTPFLDVSGQVSTSGEQGLLSMAFSPRAGRRFYINLTDRSGDTRIIEYQVRTGDPNRAKATSARQVMRISQPASNHNGGQLQFGPDRLLYVGMGDGGFGGDPQNRAQDMSTLLGKMLRIDPRRSGARPYRVPADNPFVGETGVRPEIYASGLRNPWRFSFDRVTGALTIADVGQDSWEEINYSAPGTAAGANFGWRVFEGPDRYADGSAPGAQAPVLGLRHSDGYCSVTGGYVVRDQALTTLNGSYLYGDFCNPDVRAVDLGPGSAAGDRSTGMRVESLVSFGEDARGRVYAVSLNGPVYRIA